MNGRRSIEGYAIRYLQELTAGLEIDLNLQYATINGDALPKFTPQVTLNTTSLASIATVPRIVTQRLSRTQASFGFPVTPGKRYQLRSTVNLTDWIVDNEFTAAGNVWEWLAEIQQQAGQLYQLRELTQ